MGTRFGTRAYIARAVTRAYSSASSTGSSPSAIISVSEETVSPGARSCPSAEQRASIVDKDRSSSTARYRISWNWRSWEMNPSSKFAPDSGRPNRVMLCDDHQAPRSSCSTNVRLKVSCWSPLPDRCTSASDVMRRP